MILSALAEDTAKCLGPASAVFANPLPPLHESRRPNAPRHDINKDQKISKERALAPPSQTSRTSTAQLSAPPSSSCQIWFQDMWKSDAKAGTRPAPVVAFWLWLRHGLSLPHFSHDHNPERLKPWNCFDIVIESRHRLDLTLHVCGAEQHSQCYEHPDSVRGGLSPLEAGWYAALVPKCIFMCFLYLFMCGFTLMM